MENNNAFCQNCGTAIGKSQKFCGNCGKPLTTSTGVNNPSQKTPSSKGKLAATAIFFVLAVYLVNHYSSDATLPATKTNSGSATSTEQAPSTTNAAPKPAEEAIKVSADDYFLDYFQNEVTADDKYKGKLITIHGTVKTISKDATNTPYITLAAGENESVPIYSFPTEKARELSIGMEVSVTCRGNGMSLLSPNMTCK